MRKIFPKPAVCDQDHSDNHAQHAQGIVEFALVLPILLLLVFGVIEFGRLLFMYTSVTAASREGARYGAATGDFSGIYRYKDCDGIMAAVTRLGGIAGVDQSNVSISYELFDVDGMTTIQGCPPSLPVNLADRIVVSVTTDFNPLVPLVNIPAIPISSTTARTIVKSVYINSE